MKGQTGLVIGIQMVLFGVKEIFLVRAPEVSVYECRRFSPALIGLRLKQTVVDVDRMRQVPSALLIT